MQETGGIDFTVQDIVDRSGLSLRSFYKHFGGKDELLLALFEELLADFAADLRADVGGARGGCAEDYRGGGGGFRDARSGYRYWQAVGGAGSGGGG